MESDHSMDMQALADIVIGRKYVHVACYPIIINYSCYRVSLVLQGLWMNQDTSMNNI